MLPPPLWLWYLGLFKCLFCLLFSPCSSQLPLLPATAQYSTAAPRGKTTLFPPHSSALSSLCVHSPALTRALSLACSLTTSTLLRLGLKIAPPVHSRPRSSAQSFAKWIRLMRGEKSVDRGRVRAWDEAERRASRRIKRRMRRRRIKGRIKILFFFMLLWISAYISSSFTGLLSFVSRMRYLVWPVISKFLPGNT